MRTNFTSTDESLVLRLTFNPVAGPDSTGSVTIPTTGGSLTTDGTDYTGISGSCTLPAEQNADPDNTTASYTGTFALAIAPNSSTSLSGTVTGSFTSDRTFCPQSFTDVTLASPLDASDCGLTLLPPPPDEEDIAMGTASVIIKPQ
jgi:hypothetical protein